MSCPTVKKAFEDSLNKATLNVTDEFLVYDNGTIYNVNYGDLVTQLGVTGSITSEGTGSALFSAVDNVYTFGTLKGGDGITVQAAVGGGLAIKANLGNAGATSDGERVLKNTLGTTLDLKRIKAGSGINVTSETNSVVVSLEGNGAGVTNLVTVSEEADFPTAVGGVITLADNTEYRILANVTTSNRFATGSNTVISGLDAFVTTLTYTGTGAMFTFGDGNVGFKRLALAFPNGSLMDASATTSGTVLYTFCRWAGKDLGILGHSNTAINNSFCTSWTGDGFDCSTNITAGRMNISSLTFVNATKTDAIFMDLGTSTFDALSIENLTFLGSVAATQYFMTGQAGGTNLTTDAIGYVNRVTINGDMLGLDTIDPNDVGWDFTDCNKISNTFPIALADLSAAATTTISTVDTPVVVNGTFSAEADQQFTVSAGGRCTYNGKRTIFADMTAALTSRPTSGTKTYTYYIAKNGVVEAGSGISRETAAGAIGNVSLVWAVELDTDDYIEVYVENNTDAQNVEFTKCVLRVKG